MHGIYNVCTFASLKKQRYNRGFKVNGFLAQLVEQWIENPCVPGSIPGETTKNHLVRWFFLFFNSIYSILIILLKVFYKYFGYILLKFSIATKYGKSDKY